MLFDSYFLAVLVLIYEVKLILNFFVLRTKCHAIDAVYFVCNKLIVVLLISDNLLNLQTFVHFYNVCAVDF